MNPLFDDNGFNNTAPYTDFHEMNLDWVLAKIKELEARINGIDESILSKAKAYTDEQLAGYQSQVDQLRADLQAQYDAVERDFDQLQLSINVSLRQMEMRIDDLRADMIANINAVNERTDLAIEQNNVYILNELAHFLSGIQVLNALTGTEMTLQEMLNYLCTLHMTDAITYTALASKQNTYTQLAGYNMTYTQLAMNGNNIIQ